MACVVDCSFDCACLRQVEGCNCRVCVRCWLLLYGKEEIRVSRFKNSEQVNKCQKGRKVGIEMSKKTLTIIIASIALAGCSAGFDGKKLDPP